MGFPRLVSEVALGKGGAILGLEVSRLARSCSDWYRLLEAAALAGALIVDEEGIYDPNEHNALKSWSGMALGSPYRMNARRSIRFVSSGISRLASRRHWPMV